MTIGRTVRFSRRLATWMIWGLLISGLALRLTVRDRFYPLDLIYYVTPVPSFPIWMVLAALASIRRFDGPMNIEAGKKRSKWTLPILQFLIGLIAVIWTLNFECVNRALPARSEDLRIVFWNVAHVKVDVPRLAKQLKSYNAHVIALVEAEEKNELNVEQWQSELPEYQVVGTRFGGLIAVKGSGILAKEYRLTISSCCGLFNVRVGDVEFTLLLADISSDLTKSRKRRIYRLANLADEIKDRPAVIVGDFNTPDDSIWMAPIRENFRQAFRERGNGYAATWPLPLPVLTIDQIWVNQFFDVTRCENGWTTYSDHRPVISDMSFRRQQ